MNLGTPNRLDAQTLIDLAERATQLSLGQWSVLLLQKAFPEAWRDWTRVTIEGTPLWIVSRQGLIAMKKARSSKKDLSDLELLIQDRK